MSEQNVTTMGDYLWTNMIVGEVFPTAITPSSWSVWQDFFNNLSFGDTPSIDSIAGRPYLNYSATYSFLLKIMRKDERVRDMVKDSIGIPPNGVSIPLFPITWRLVLFQILPREIKNELKKRRLKKNAPQFLAMVQERCLELQPRIGDAQKDDLITLWKDEIRPLWSQIHFLQDKQNEELNLRTSKLKTELTKILGDDEANTFMSTISSAGELASVGPLVGLSRLSRGELSRQDYLQQYGHRGPNENELAEPRQYEDPNWLDRQLAEFRQSPVNVAELIAKRDAEANGSLSVIKRTLTPDKAQALERKVNGIVETNSIREETRSELTRIVSVIRAWFLRAGDLTKLGEGVFFLTVDEVVNCLSGDRSAAAQITSRRELYGKYSSLPLLPTWIRGYFDPFKWVADPNRRMDVFVPDVRMAPVVPSTDIVIKGHPGSAGRVEGIVRQIGSPDDGDQLQSGEILVTRMTNVGWTPLFPRAAAVVTDIGGSLSHTAIVARELGIPAVVGCGDATIRLKTGFRVRVDGGQGMVEILGRG